MTKSSLRARLERQVPIQVIDRARSGSPVDLILRFDREQARKTPPNTITAAITLARNGLTLLKAKRAMDRLLDDSEAVVHVPMVGDLCALVRELSEAGLQVTRMATDDVDVRSVRERLGLTQEQFALRFNLDIDAVRNWEQGRRTPDRAVMNYLRVIEERPDVAALAQEVPI